MEINLLEYLMLIPIPPVILIKVAKKIWKKKKSKPKNK